MQREAWRDDDIALLRRLWAEGVTAQVIAERIGYVSRSAVLGKIFRLRLPPGGDTAKAAAPPRAATAASAAPARRRPAAAAIAPPAEKTARQGRTLFELTNDCCRWPYRRPGTERYFFCGAAGADLEGGVPYCARHMKRAYLVPPPMKPAPTKNPPAKARTRWP